MISWNKQKQSCPQCQSKFARTLTTKVLVLLSFNINLPPKRIIFSYYGKIVGLFNIFIAAFTLCFLCMTESRICI